MLDTEKAFNELQDGTIKAISSYFPVKGRKREVILNSLSVEEVPERDDLQGQLSSKLSGSVWGASVRGNFSLVDIETGKVIDRRTMKVATLPRITNRYSFIFKGKEYSFSHQLRLRPSAYSRVGASGKLEVQFNLAGAIGGKDGRPDPKGHRFVLEFDQKRRRFALTRYHHKTGLYPLLSVLGVSDVEMEDAWGKEVLAANRADQMKQVEALFKSIMGRAPKDYKEMEDHFRWAFSRTQMDPDVTAATVGVASTTLDGNVLLNASRKLLDVARGDSDPDDRNSLENKKVLGFAEFIPEQLTKPANKWGILKKLRNGADRYNDLRHIISSSLFGSLVSSEFTAGHAETGDQINPVSMISHHTSTTLMGPGGIISDHQVEDAAKSISPSSIGYLDPIHTPESARTGVSLQLAIGAQKDNDTLTMRVWDVKAKKFIQLSMKDARSSVIALPDQVEWKNGQPHFKSKKVMTSYSVGDLKEVPVAEVQYILPSAKGMFALASNLVPFLQNNQGNRAMMAVRQLEQAVGLKEREIPLVQTLTDNPSVTFDSVVGADSSFRSPAAGVVKEVTPDKIVIREQTGKLHTVQIYNNFPLNEESTFYHATPVVRVGDRVTKGQLLADTNFTKGGVLALGTNLKYAYIPYKGYNHDDGIVVSESAAKKLTSEHLYRFSSPSEATVSKQYMYLFGAKITPQQARKLDADGVIKEGATVEADDVLIAAYSVPDMKKPEVKEMIRLGLRADTIKDEAVRWGKNAAGTVVRVVKAGNAATVFVKTEEAAQVGDKIVGRHANKGVITQVLPDIEMPRTKDGPVEVLFNPLGVPSRINAGQILETAASKVAKKTGKPVKISNFDTTVKDWTEEIDGLLKKNGLSDKETLYDPKTGKPLGDVLVGYQYTLKQKHRVEAKGKYNVRAGGPGYRYSLINRTPSSGAGQSGQTMDFLGLYALLAHGARENVREMQTIKANSDEDFWIALQEGKPIPTPDVPFVYNKFESYLKGMGVNVKKEGNQLLLTPLTDKQTISMVKETGGGEITAPSNLLIAKTLVARKGGLFDPNITGGINGTRWSYIKLGSRMPNPVFEEPIETLLGLPRKTLYNPSGKSLMTYDRDLDGKTGAEAVVSALKSIDVDKELAKAQKDVKRSSGAKRNVLVKKIRYLQALKDQKLSPVDAYTQKYIPVLPPTIRPFVPATDDMRMDPLNYLYAQLGVRNQMLREMPKQFSDDHRKDLEKELYDSMRALTMVGAVVSNVSRQHKEGIMELLSGGAPGEGGSPKQGFFQKMVMGKRQDLSMRSTIVPEPAMSMDEIGIPRQAALELYKPFLVRRMVGRYGFTPGRARDEAEAASPTALKVLEEELENRPILVKRDPALHKFNVMAFKPVLVDGRAVKIHPLVTSGFNADFDGDQMSGYVPISQEAVEEAFKMLPSNNLFSATSGNVMYAPKQEALLGLHLLTKINGTSGRKFKTITEAMKAYTAKEIRPDVEITVGGKKTTIGRALIASVLPKDYDGPLRNQLLNERSFVLTKKDLSALVDDLATRFKGEFPDAVRALQDIGFDAAYSLGFSIGLDDIRAEKTVRNKILSAANTAVKKVVPANAKGPEAEEKTVAVYSSAVNSLDGLLRKALSEKPTSLSTMVLSGAKGSMSQLRQMVAGPGLVQDNLGRTVPTPVFTAYSEGLPISQYWATMHGARMGAINRAQETAPPGALTKSIINATTNLVVSMDDCGTHDGILLSVEDPDIIGRYVANDYRSNGLTLERNTQITPLIIKKAKEKRVQKILVRSPLKCEAIEGVCAKCVGHQRVFGDPQLGTNVGVIAAQSMGEPLTQMMLNAFHTGGVQSGAGTGAVAAFDQVEQLLNAHDKLKGEAVIATVDGTIQKIEKDPAGGWGITIDKVRHYVPSSSPLPSDVVVGAKVRKGDPLSLGVRNPRHLLDVTGNMSMVQNYLTDALHDVYSKSDQRLLRRNVETVVRSITNIAQVEDPGDAEDVYPGMIMPYTKIQSLNKNLRSPILAKPILKGITQVPTSVQEDWMARLQHQGLRQTIIDAAAMGWKSNLHGLNPIPGMAFGKEFGRGIKDQGFLY